MVCYTVCYSNETGLNADRWSGVTTTSINLLQLSATFTVRFLTQRNISQNTTDQKSSAKRACEIKIK